MWPVYSIAHPHCRCTKVFFRWTTKVRMKQFLLHSNTCVSSHTQTFFSTQRNDCLCNTRCFRDGLKQVNMRHAIGCLLLSFLTPQCGVNTAKAMSNRLLNYKCKTYFYPGLKAESVRTVNWGNVRCEKPKCVTCGCQFTSSFWVKKVFSNLTTLDTFVDTLHYQYNKISGNR